MSYGSVLNVSNGRPSNPKLTLKINSLRIKCKAQNFASWMLSEYAFKIGRKKGNYFLIIVPINYLLYMVYPMTVNSHSDWPKGLLQVSYGMLCQYLTENPFLLTLLRKS